MRPEQTPDARPRDWEGALRRFLAARSRREAEQELERLYREFFSVAVNRVLAEELRRGVPADKEELDETRDSFNDISLMVRAGITRRLLTLWEQPPPKEGISHLHAYVVSAARNACVDYLRRKYPGRHALDNALRAAFDNRPALALWRTPRDGGVQEWRCGKPEWQDKAPVGLRFDEPLQGRVAAAIRDLSRADALPRIFEVTQAPLRFVELLSFLGDLWDVEEPHRTAEREYVPFRVPKPYQSGFQPEEIVTLIGTLQTLWRQICTLSPLQAATLLLKFPEFEAGSYLNALVRFDITTWPALARTMGLETSRLREVAANAPLEDTEIAELLGLAPEDIPRIRQDARRRLKRREEREQGG